MKNFFEEELKYFNKHKKKLLEQYEGKFVLIKESEMLGDFSTEEEAYNAGVEKFGNKPFLIKKVQKKDETDIAPVLFIH